MRICCWLISFLVFSLLGGTTSVNGQTYSFKYSNNPPSNPWIRHSPGSDPAANVWGDTVWVYCSQDANLRLEGLGPDVYKYDYMDGYRALSSTDMVNWVDHGVVMHSRNVSWAMRGWMWAPSAQWNGKTGADAKYYLYYPCKDSTGGVWRIGVAIAPTPAGPFIDIGYPIAGLSGIDPHVFKDDDNQIYLYYNRHEVVKLKDNYIEIAEPVRQIDYGQSNLEARFQFEEGSFMHKYNGKYYFSYSHWHATEPTMAYYAVGTSPYGPFEWKGGLTGRKSGSQDHHSIIQFKGEWYYFTHMDTPWKERFVDLNWYGQRRISCYQKMYYNSDGTINQVDPTAWALNTGEDGPFISSDGVEYYWDQWYSWTNSNIRTVDSTVSIANTVDDQIYRSFRWGTTFTYDIPVQNNLEYLVTFKFAELSHDGAGMRKFSVIAEGETKITDLDVFAKAGGKNTAYDETHTIIVRDHVMNIQFTSSIDNAMIAGLYIRPKVSVVVPTVPAPAPIPSPVTAPVPAAPVPTPIAPMAPAPVPVAPVPMPIAAPVPAPVNAPVPIAPVPAPTAPVPVPVAPVPMPIAAPVPSPVNAPVPVAPVPAPTAPAPVPVAPVPAPVPMPLAPVPSPVKAPVPIAPVPAPRAPMAPAPVPIAPVRAPVLMPMAPVPTPSAAVPVAPVPAPLAPVPAPVPMPMSPIPVPSAPVSAPVPAPVAPILAPSAPVAPPVPMPLAPVPTPSAPIPLQAAPVPTPSATVPVAPVPAPPAPVLAPVPMPMAPIPVPSAPVPAPVPSPMAPVLAPSAPVAPPAPMPIAPVPTPSAPIPLPTTAPVPTSSAPVPMVPVPTQSDPPPVAAPSGSLPTLPPVPIAPPLPVPTGPIAPIAKEPTIPPRVPSAPALPPTSKPKFPTIRSFLKWLLGLAN